jgi:hypothetical protein
MGLIATIFSGLSAASGFFTGLFGSINNVTSALSNEKIAGINAKTDEERLASQERVNTLTLRRDLMIAEAATSGLNIKMRFILALGPASILLKMFLWDKVIGSFVGCSQAPKGTCGIFVTDPLDPNLWQVVMVVLGFYFLCESAITTAKIFKTGK